MKAYRSKRFMDWLRDRYRVCQKTGYDPFEHPAELQFCHPPRRRPWIGKVFNTWSPGKEKASDLGGLMLTPEVHEQETRRPADTWGTHRGLPERDIISVGNLVAYAEHLDPGSNLWAEGIEWMQARVKELEDEQPD